MSADPSKPRRSLSVELLALAEAENEDEQEMTMSNPNNTPTPATQAAPQPEQALTDQEQVREALNAGYVPDFEWLPKYDATKAWERLDWQEAESGEYRTHYAYAEGLQYRAALCEDGALEFVQVRCDPRLLAARARAERAEAALAEAEALVQEWRREAEELLSEAHADEQVARYRGGLLDSASQLEQALAKAKAGER